MWGLLVGFLGLIYFFTETTEGLQLAAQIASSQLPGKVRIGKLDGKLFSAFTFKDITYEDTYTRVTIQSLHFDWNPTPLLNYVLSINQLNLDNVTIKILSTSKSTHSNFQETVKYFAHHIAANQITIHNLVIDEGGSPVEIHFDGTLAKDWNIQWSADVPNLTRFRDDVHGNFKSVGKITGPRFAPDIEATFQLDNFIHQKEQIHHLTGKFYFTFKPNIPTSLSLTGENVQLADYKIKKLDLGISGLVTQEKNNFLGSFNIAFNQKPYVQLALTVPKSINFENYASESIQAKLNVNFPDIQVLKEKEKVKCEI